MEQLAKVIGNNIKTARKLKGLTQKDVAQVFHMTQQQYSRFENGVFELNYTQIYENYTQLRFVIYLFDNF